MIKWLRDPELLGLLIIAGLAAFYLTQLPIGELSRYDEFKTLDRSNGFLLFGDWTTVYASNVPNFQKPPLQYWMGAILLSTGMDEHLAMKLPSWVFSIVCLFATAALVRNIAPRHPWAVPAALILLASSTEFWPYAMSGMLETGSAAFVSLALLFGYRGFERPGAWWWAAIFIGLGALQKSPAALVVVIVFIAGAATACWMKGAPMPGLRSRHFAGAAFAALLLVAAWPLLQLRLNGYEALRVSIQREMLDRFVPGDETGQRGLQEVWRIVVRDEPFLRLGGIAGLFFLPGLLKEPRIWGFTAVAVGYVLAVLLAGGAIYPRYTLNFVPLFSAILAIWIFRSAWSMRRKWFVTAVGSVLMLGPISPAKPPVENAGSPPEVLAAVGAQLRPDEMLLVCAWESRLKVSPGTVSYYASNGRPFEYLLDNSDLEGLHEELAGKPLRGLCSRAEFALLQSVFPQAEPLQPVGDGFVHFVVRP